MLHLAASLGFKCLTSALLDWDMDVNLTDTNGLTPLHLACIFRHGDCARMLLDYDADPNVVDDWGRSSWDLGELADNASDEEDSQHGDGPADEDDFVSDPGYSSAISGKSIFRKSFHKYWFKATAINVTSMTSTPTSIDSSLPSLPDTSPVLKSMAPRSEWIDESPPAYSSIQAPYATHPAIGRALTEKSDEKVYLCSFGYNLRD
jgi:Ankyrin repeats (many copies)